MNIADRFTSENFPLRLIALITWLLVSYTIVFNLPELFSMDKRSIDQPPHISLFDQLHMSFWLILYLVGNLMATSGDPYGLIRVHHKLGVLLMSVCLFPIVLFGPKQDEQLILLVVLAAVLGYIIPAKRAFVIIAVFYLVVGGIYRWRWYRDFYWPGSLMYLGFCVFALISNNIARRESLARKELTTAHKQLVATQQLLTDSAISDERLRIARDLHDGIGHHLTALSLQLEVAKNLAKGKVLEHVEQAQALSKLLLADVRQVVSDTRSVPSLNINNSLERLMESAKGRAELKIDSNLSIKSTRIVEALFRLVQEIITNSNRHSPTHQLKVSLTESTTDWILKTEEGGEKAVDIIPGSGISGMRERVEALGGNFELSTNYGVSYNISLPKT